MAFQVDFYLTSRVLEGTIREGISYSDCLSCVSLSVALVAVWHAQVFKLLLIWQNPKIPGPSLNRERYRDCTARKIESEARVGQRLRIDCNDHHLVLYKLSRRPAFTLSQWYIHVCTYVPPYEDLLAGSCNGPWRGPIPFVGLCIDAHTDGGCRRPCVPPRGSMLGWRDNGQSRPVAWRQLCWTRRSGQPNVR